jgi:hypothetical protein
MMAEDFAGRVLPFDGAGAWGGGGDTEHGRLRGVRDRGPEPLGGGFRMSVVDKGRKADLRCGCEISPIFLHFDRFGGTLS